jgi:hypothetical protein
LFCSPSYDSGCTYSDTSTQNVSHACTALDIVPK